MTILATIIFASVALTSYGGCKHRNKEINTKYSNLKESLFNNFRVVDTAFEFGELKENSDNGKNKEKNVTSSSKSEITEENSYVSVDCDKFIQDYTAFVNSYIKILKKYKANPTDASILSEYTKAAQKAAKLQNNASSCNDSKYAAKLMELSNKIAKALM